MTGTSSYQTLLVSTDGPVFRIAINRPDQLNALNAQVLSELERALFHDMDADATRAVVIEGAGDRAFVAGADVAAMREMTPAAAREFSRHGQMITKALESLPQATIAKVHGYALGGGCELALACDLVVAGRTAKFGQPEVNLGIIPGFGGTQRLVRRLGLPVALDLLLCGRARSLSGPDAYQLGLISRVVDDDKLEDEVRKVLRALLAAAPSAIAETKRLTREAYGMSLDAGLNAEANAFAACFAGDEAEEGIDAFLTKRSPAFSLDPPGGKP
jgi:enoyl-CoA hydratase